MWLLGTTFGNLPHMHIKIMPQQEDTDRSIKQTQELRICVTNELIQHYSVTKPAAEYNGASKHRIN